MAVGGLLGVHSIRFSCRTLKDAQGSSSCDGQRLHRGSVGRLRLRQHLIRVAVKTKTGNAAAFDHSVHSAPMIRLTTLAYLDENDLMEGPVVRVQKTWISICTLADITSHAY